MPILVKSDVVSGNFPTKLQIENLEISIPQISELASAVRDLAEAVAKSGALAPREYRYTVSSEPDETRKSPALDEQGAVEEVPDDLFGSTEIISGFGS